jgi:ABC-type transport system involved in multi-copper enzyme maturation permease subunit
VRPHLFKSEFRKVIYTKTFYGYTLGAIALAVLSAYPAAYAVTKTSTLLSGSNLMDPQMVDGIYGKALSGYLFVTLLGIIFMGNEFQNGMAISTYLATPKRIHVLRAKLLISAGVGAVMMLISTSIGLLAAYLGLSHYKHAAPTSSNFLNILVAAVVTGAVLSIMGVAIGALVRNVRIASTATMIYLLVVERLIVLFWSTGGKYLPSGLIVGMMNVHLKTKLAKGGLSINTNDYLGALPSTILLLAYAGVFAALAIFISLRKDVD